MKILCLYSTDEGVTVDKPLASFLAIPHGLASIASVLRQDGCDVHVIVRLAGKRSAARLRACLEEFRPDIVCASSVTSQYPLIRESAIAVRRWLPQARILLGGAHASLNPGETIAGGMFDGICIGEGEQAAREYVGQLRAGGGPPTGIANLWLRSRETGVVEMNRPRPFQADLDSLPDEDAALWEDEVAGRSGLFDVVVGRGCPNRCTYCSNHALAALAPGRFVRFRSPQRVVDEIRGKVLRYPFIRGIILRAETLSVDLPYTLALCAALREMNRGLPRPLAFTMPVSPRGELLARGDFFSTLKATGVSCLNMALESGSARVRRDVLRRPAYSNDDVVAICRAARDAGIAVSLCSMMGLPGETLAEYRETVACARNSNPDHAHLYIFYPYPGTDLYRRAKEMSLFSGAMVKPAGERKVARLDQPGFRRRRVQWEYLTFHYRAFHGRKPWLTIVARMGWELLNMSPRLGAGVRRLKRRGWLRRLASRLATDPKSGYWQCKG
ncbi:MAG TPA: radical SAM protein [Acidobacteriota bacterium]